TQADRPIRQHPRALPPGQRRLRRAPGARWQRRPPERPPAGEADAPAAQAPPTPAPRLPPGSAPPQTRDGYPVRMGPNATPGPGDTYVAYGRGWANVSNTPLREYKHWVHEGGISTPLVAHWPARITAKGQLRNQPGHLIDVMATCLDVAGAKPLKLDEKSPL